MKKVIKFLKEQWVYLLQSIITISMLIYLVGILIIGFYGCSPYKHTGMGAEPMSPYIYKQMAAKDSCSNPYTVDDYLKSLDSYNEHESTPPNGWVEDSLDIK